MGILSSMYTARSGLQAMGDALGVYGDNIANANTVGFKTNRPEFSDVMVKSGRGGAVEVGRGSKINAINPIFSQGSVLQTESGTDLSISGEGFFVVEDTEGKAYTRNGAFHFDKDGKLVNAENARVLGYKADDRGKVTSEMGGISVDRTVIDAKGSETVSFFLNLDNRAKVGLKFDEKKPDQTSHFATGATVYDTAGAPHAVTLYFNKSGEGEWEWRAMAKGEESIGGKPGQAMEHARGRLIFDTDGRLKDQIVDKSAFNFVGGALPDQNIKFNFGSDKKSGGSGLEVTQYGTNSEAYKITQDGFTAGTLVGLSFGPKGVLQAIYSNGETINIAQVALAKFDAKESLMRAGENKFRETRVSGQPTIGASESGGRGTIQPKTLESSTTDIANEFINLMNTQRSFQANSRVISTADEMMQEVLNLKRG